MRPPVLTLVSLLQVCIPASSRAGFNTCDKRLFPTATATCLSGIQTNTAFVAGELRAITTALVGNNNGACAALAVSGHPYASALVACPGSAEACVPRESCPGYVFDGCVENECQPSNQKGFVVEFPSATTVTAMGTVHCHAPRFTGKAVVQCASGVFTFTGCERVCAAGTGDRSGFSVSQSATTLSTTDISCARSFGGSPKAFCAADGNFSFSGCTELSCAAMSGDRTGYTVEVPSATTVTGLQSLSCMDGFSSSSPWEGTHGPTAVCNSPINGGTSSGQFAFYGCTENVCALRGEDTRAAYSLDAVWGLSPEGVLMDLTTLTRRCFVVVYYIIEL
jgi:hypothetical protein